MLNFLENPFFASSGQFELCVVPKLGFEVKNHDLAAEIHPLGWISILLHALHRDLSQHSDGLEKSFYYQYRENFICSFDSRHFQRD